MVTAVIAIIVEQRTWVQRHRFIHRPPNMVVVPHRGQSVSAQVLDDWA
jgi:hypothetical protein